MKTSEASAYGLQFHLLPIRDWNSATDQDGNFNVGNCNFIYSLLGIETFLAVWTQSQRLLQFHLLPIRDWNRNKKSVQPLNIKLQFHLLPIRDWNNWIAIFSNSREIAISFTPY